MIWVVNNLFPPSAEGRDKVSGTAVVTVSIWGGGCYTYRFFFYHILKVPYDIKNQNVYHIVFYHILGFQNLYHIRVYHILIKFKNFIIFPLSYFKYDKL